MSEQAAEFLRVGPDNDSREIAILHRPAISGKSAPMLVWLGGYRSDMTGTKAVELDRFAAENGLACLRFDYSGHGASGGDFKRHDLPMAGRGTRRSACKGAVERHSRRLFDGRMDRLAHG